MGIHISCKLVGYIEDSDLMVAGHHQHGQLYPEAYLSMRLNGNKMEWPMEFPKQMQALKFTHIYIYMYMNSWA